MKKTRHTHRALNSNCTPTSAHATRTPPTAASPIDAIQILEQIEHWPANSNSDPDTMGEALDQIQQLAGDAVRSLRSHEAQLSHHLIINGEDRFGPFLMIGDFRAAMPSKEAAHLIAQLLNKQSYCGQPDCPCGPVDPPHAAAFTSNATQLPWDYGVTNEGIPYICQMGGLDIARFELTTSRPQQQQIANAILAVRAVNTHVALVATLREKVAHLERLRNLVSRAFDRFTDNDMQPPNTLLAKWLDDAKKALT
jgi:hypothetical protein